MVFGQTVDGGYYLVGMKKPLKEAFGLSEYGHGTVFEETVKVLEKAGLTVGYVEILEDMDTPEDLRGYRARMRDCERLKQSETGKYLAKIAKISIIIPVYNEEKDHRKVAGADWKI